MAAITSATSSVSTGDVRPEPKGSRIVPSRAIDSAAQARKKKCWRKTVGRTWTTGSPDQLSACSASQCCRCCGESVVSARLICDIVIWEMLTNISRSPCRRAAAKATDVAGEDGPVGAELELHDDAGGDAHREVDGEDARPEPGHLVINDLAGAQVRPLHDDHEMTMIVPSPIDSGGK